LLFSEAYFDTTPPAKADIGMADRQAGGSGPFVRRADMATILAAINTAEHLEYAPALSHDGLELYFTRLVYLQAAPTEFATCPMVAKRSSVIEPLGAPAVIAAITPERHLLHEAPSLIPDGAMLYDHKRDTGSVRVALWAVSRSR